MEGQCPKIALKCPKSGYFQQKVKKTPIFLWLFIHYCIPLSRSYDLTFLFLLFLLL